MVLDSWNGAVFISTQVAVKCPCWTRRSAVVQTKKKNTSESAEDCFVCFKMSFSHRSSGLCSLCQSVVLRLVSTLVQIHSRFPKTDSWCPEPQVPKFNQSQHAGVHNRARQVLKNLTQKIKTKQNLAAKATIIWVQISWCPLRFQTASRAIQLCVSRWNPSLMVRCPVFPVVLPQ